MLRALGIAALFVLAPLSFAKTSILAEVQNVIDGDTLKVNAEIWPDLKHVGNVRVRGVDTPELRGQCEQEKALAIAARDFVRELLFDQTVILSEIENDKYGGRVIARVHLAAGDDLAEVIIEAGYGRPYEGGAREGWCDEDIVVPDAEIPKRPPATDPLALYDDNANGYVSCGEAKAHGIAPVKSGHAAYEFMTDRDGDGVVCE